MNAAITCFSRSLYTEVSLRDLAAVADVDVAYVHRSYGSKRKLFRAALTELLQVDELFAQPCTPDEMINRMSTTLALGCPGNNKEVRALDLIFRSCTSAEPQEILREAVEQQFLPPLSGVFGEDEKVAISFCMSLLLGVAIMREALAVEPIASLSPEHIKGISGQILHAILERNQPMQ